MFCSLIIVERECEKVSNDLAPNERDSEKMRISVNQICSKRN